MREVAPRSTATQRWSFQSLAQRVVSPVRPEGMPPSNAFCGVCPASW